MPRIVELDNFRNGPAKYLKEGDVVVVLNNQSPALFGVFERASDYISSHEGEAGIESVKEAVKERSEKIHRQQSRNKKGKRVKKYE